MAKKTSSSRAAAAAARPSRDTVAEPAPAPAAPPAFWRVARPMLLLLAVAAAFFPVLGHEFLEWDDHVAIYENPDFLPPTPATLGHYWTRAHLQFYVPVTYTIWWTLAHVAYYVTPDGVPMLWPLPYHAANFTAHLGSTLFLYLVLARLVRSPWAAWVGAALFALHPLQVEPVSWASTMYSSLSGCFSLAAAWAYFHFSDARFGPPVGEAGAEPGGHRRTIPARRRWAWLAAFVTLYALALLTKPTVILLPVILAVIDVALRGRSVRGVALVMAPLLVAGALPIVVATQKAQPAIGVDSPVVLRPLIAADALAFYLWKTVWPLNVGPDYGRSPRWLMNEGSRALFLTWIVPFAAFAAAAVAWRRTRWPAVAGAVFVLGLAPVLGLTPFDYQRYSTVADRYAYFALVAPAMLVAAALARRPSRTLFGAVLAVAAGLGVLSHRQTRHWHTTERFYDFAMARNPDSFAAHTYEIRVLTRQGREIETLDHYRASNRVFPDSPRMWFMHGRVALNNGLLDEAIECLTRSVNLAEPNAQIYAHLAVALARRGRSAEAVAAATQAVTTDPRDADVHLKAGVVFGSAGRLDEARQHFETVIALRGDVAAAEQALAQLKVLAKPSTAPATQPKP